MLGTSLASSLCPADLGSGGKGESSSLPIESAAGQTGAKAFSTSCPAIVLLRAKISTTSRQKALLAGNYYSVSSQLCKHLSQNVFPLTNVPRSRRSMWRSLLKLVNPSLGAR